MQIFLSTSAVPGHAGAWVLSSDLVDPSGRVVVGGGASGPSSTIARSIPISTTSGPCAPTRGPGADACTAEINRLGYRQQATYQPLEGFWPLQWIETGIYALLTLALACLCFRRVRKGLS
jgi:hypothetical protein